MAMAGTVGVAGGRNMAPVGFEPEPEPEPSRLVDGIDEEHTASLKIQSITRGVQARHHVIMDMFDDHST